MVKKKAMEKLSKEFGRHYLVEFINCNRDRISFVSAVKQIFLKSAEKSKAVVLKYFFHQFKPWGVSGVILIAESHFAIHTWPEENYAAFDVFTCGEMYPELAVNELKRGFKAKKVKVKIFPRGF